MLRQISRKGRSVLLGSDMNIAVIEFQTRYIPLAMSALEPGRVLWPADSQVESAPGVAFGPSVQVSPFPEMEAAHWTDMQTPVSARLKLAAASWEGQVVLTMQEIRSIGLTFRLNRPLRVLTSFKEDAWWCSSQELGISAFGRSQAEALDSFREDFAVFWEAIAQAPDDSLAADALAAKRAFHRLVEAVEAE
jgi:hypothetical protein